MEEPLRAHAVYLLTKTAYNQITNSGAEALQQADWGKLEAVFLDFNRVTKRRGEFEFRSTSAFLFV